MSQSQQRISGSGSASGSGIAKTVAVASGKGGVGKSTVAVNLALALARGGAARVGLVDADVLGPTVPALLGIPYGVQPAEHDGRFVPVERYGIKAISMGMITGHDAPAILRGPMVTKYMRLFVEGVLWGKLDYLLIDLPPGTGDVQLTLAQSIALSGAVIVTTPQEVSLGIARRGLRMFEKVGVPVLGVIENMSGFVCPHCGQPTDIFRRGGAMGLADQTGVPLLGAIPLDPEVVAGGDCGEPIVAAKPQAVVSVAFCQLAERLVQRLNEQVTPALPPFRWDWASDGGRPPWRAELVRAPGIAADEPLGLTRRDARTLAVLWGDGREDRYDLRDLRLSCPCAVCVDENTGRKVLRPESVPLDVTPTLISNVGRYAIAVAWTDGHTSGIYAFARLRQLGEHSHSQAGGFEL